MENIKLYLRPDGFTDNIENLENKADALEIQESNENYIQFIDRIFEKASEINPKFNKQLEKDVYDENWKVRHATVGKQGYDLDRLINDEDYRVRVAVAEQKHKLEDLINDRNFLVRAAVAEQGYGLDILINDKSVYVRCIAKEKLDSI